MSKENPIDEEQVDDPLGFSKSSAPTYSFSVEENIVVPDPQSFLPFVVSGPNFELAQVITEATQSENGTSKGLDENTYTMIPTPFKKNPKGIISDGRAIPTELRKCRDDKDAEKRQQLRCEWEDCTFSVLGSDLNQFMSHVTQHTSDLPVVFTRVPPPHGENESQKELVNGKTFGCLWADCGFESVDNAEMVRHINFHTFHTYLKACGSAMLETTGIEPCKLDHDQRNLLPQLPENDFKCQWYGCDRADTGYVFQEPLKFYWHVQWHAEEYRPWPLEAKRPKGEKAKIACKWASCSTKAAYVHRLRTHLKCHTAERSIACPVCGGLFCNRTKLLDHCQRQVVPAAGMPAPKCSYCRKVFPNERLLRDHMRSHINHYSCPSCEMTCATPGSLNTHMMYRHSEDRPVSCPHFIDEDEDEQCDYRAKTIHDLNRHIQACHFGENVYPCKLCKKVLRNVTAHKFHMEKEHDDAVGPRYCCHLCTKRFRRGAYLTKHLTKIHDYKCMPGHARFRYQEDENGLYHVKTIRFQSSDLGTVAEQHDD